MNDDKYDKLEKYVVRNSDLLLVPFEEWSEDFSAFRKYVDAFQTNLVSAFLVGGFPYFAPTKRAQAVQMEAYKEQQRLYIRQQLDAGAPSQKGNYKRSLSKKHEKSANAQAHNVYKMKSGKESFQSKMNNEADIHLAVSLQDSQFLDVIMELDRQTLVMIWGSLEVVVNDCFIELLNSFPNLVIKIIESDVFRKDASFKGIAVDSLAVHSFDVSRVMGDIMFGNRKLDSISKIANICKHTFDDQSIEAIARSDALWMLSQRRNLIVHRRGVVDEKYKRSTSDKTERGKLISVSSQDLKVYAENVVGLGLSIASASRNMIGKMSG